MRQSITYTREQLLAIRPFSNKRIQHDTWAVLKNNNINGKRPTRRGGKNRRKKHASNITIASLNCQSVRNKVDVIHDAIIEYDIDILALSEHWLSDHEKDDFYRSSLKLPGYDLWAASRENGYGGVGFLYKKSLNTKIVKNEYRSFESGTLRVDIATRSIDITVVYRPPPSIKNGLSANQFFDEFSSFLHEYMLGSADKVVVGDVNFHLENHSNLNTARFNDLLENVLSKQLVNEPTHRLGHTLDIFTINSNSDLNPIVQVRDLLSDHALIVGKIDLPKPIAPKTTITSRKYGKIDKDKFKEDIKATLKFNINSDVDNLSKHYNVALSNILDKHAPEATKIVTLKPQREWYGSKLQKAKAAKRKAERKFLHSRTLKYFENFQVQRNRYNHLLAQEKRLYYNSKIRECGRDTKSIQKVVDQLLYKNNSLVLPKSTSELELANSFCKFFSDKTELIRSNLPTIYTTIDIDIPPPCSSFSAFKLVTNDHIEKLIMESSTKSCTLDPIPTWLLKECTEEMVPFITELINKSLSSGVFPENMKSALVSPLLKKASLDPNVFKNYRPVSNLSFVSKILEKVVAGQLKSYMAENNLHEKSQSAYKAFHSTETALLKIQNDIRSAVDKKEIVVLVLLDLSAAFDLIDHDVLFDRMRNILGIKGTVLEWFKSYLRGRSQSIKIGKIKSCIHYLLYCVPQGSVLGPLLFLIYILPLATLIRSHGVHTHGFADDTQLYLSMTPSNKVMLQDAIKKIESCLSNIYKWMTRNKLKLNSDKTEILFIGTENMLSKLDIPSINVCGCEIKTTNLPIKNLGVFFDCNMSMKHHVSHVVQSANYHLRNISRIRKCLSLEVAKQVITSLVLSRLDYCNSLLFGVPSTIIYKLQLIQNTAAKVIFKKRKYDHITPWLKSLHWLTIDKRIIFKILLIIFKCLHGMAPSYLSDLISIYQPGRPLRSSNDISRLVPKSSRLVNFGDRAFQIYAPKIWNSLPVSIRQSKTVHIFKRDVKTYLFRQAYNL